MRKKIKVTILISGNGSNMLALINDMMEKDHPAEPILVISDRPDAKGLKLAKSKNIKTEIVNYKKYSCRQEFEETLKKSISSSGAEIICLAGFMRILSPSFVNTFKNHILNIHPSILPLFKGLNSHAKALSSGMAVHGATVHLVSEKLDNGKILGQGIIKIFEGDTETILAKRLLKLEHKLYPLVLRKFLESVSEKIVLFDA